jgi:(S)-2-hydroxy-acid oxidase
MHSKLFLEITVFIFYCRLANFKGITRSDVTSSGKGSGINEYVTSLFDQTLTWEDVGWLKRYIIYHILLKKIRIYFLCLINRITPLPIILKGILTPEDAELAVKFGAAGIVVSSHGARQVDTVPSPVIIILIFSHLLLN